MKTFVRKFPKEPANQENKWREISNNVNLFKHSASITRSMFQANVNTKVVKDDLDYIEDSMELNELSKMTMNAVVATIKTRITIDKDEDEQFLRGNLLSIVSHIVTSSWVSSMGHAEIAKKLCNASISRVSEIYTDPSINLLKEPFVALPDNIDDQMMHVKAIIPSIETIIAIDAIQDNAIKQAILGDMTLEKMAKQAVEDTLSATHAQTEDVLMNAKTTKKYIGNERYRILQKQILNEVRGFYSITMAENLKAMKESGQYEAIYPKAKAAFDFYMPIFMSHERAKEQATSKEVAPVTTVEAVEKPVESPDVVTQKTATQESPAVKQSETQPITIKPVESQVQTTVIQEASNKPAQNVAAQNVAPDTKPIEQVTNEPVQSTPTSTANNKQSENELPIYTQSELDELKKANIKKWISVNYEIKTGKAFLIDADPNNEMNM